MTEPLAAAPEDGPRAGSGSPGRHGLAGAISGWNRPPRRAVAGPGFVVPETGKGRDIRGGIRARAFPARRRRRPRSRRGGAFLAQVVTRELGVEFYYSEPLRTCGPAGRSRWPSGRCSCSGPRLRASSRTGASLRSASQTPPANSLALPRGGRAQPLPCKRRPPARADHSNRRGKGPGGPGPREQHPADRPSLPRRTGSGQGSDRSTTPPPDEFADGIHRSESIAALRLLRGRRRNARRARRWNRSKMTKLVKLAAERVVPIVRLAGILYPLGSATATAPRRKVGASP
jgi:hypothetical protein